LKDRCIGVLDLESPGARRFTKRDVEILTLLASQAAVAIENARLYETVRANEVRLEKEVRFAQRVQAALLPVGLPKRMKASKSRRASRPRGSSAATSTIPVARGEHAGVVLGDVSGKACPRRSTACSRGAGSRPDVRRRFLPDRSGPASVLSSVNTILHQRQLEEYYCTLCYAIFDLKRRVVTLANSGLPYPIRASADGVSQIELPGVPLGAFHGSAYDELTYAHAPRRSVRVCSDGVSEAMTATGDEFGSARLIQVVQNPRASASRDRRCDFRRRRGVPRRLPPTTT
jgi:serine phosphatase RsbU (regulator of sigma subunit)